MSQRHADAKGGPDELASRAAALKLLDGALQDGAAIDRRFQKIAGGLEPRDRGFVRHLVATTLRRLGQIDAIIATFVNRAPPAPVDNILRLGAAQILFLETAPHAAVDTSVNMVKRARQPRMTGLVNAVLRKVASQGPALLADHNVPRLNTPGWLWDGWTKAYSETVAHRIGEAHMSEAPLDLTLKDPETAQTWADKLDAVVLPSGSLRRTAPGQVQELPGFEEGAWWVQDAAAALPAKVLLNAMKNTDGESVADLCSAPGGKTLQLAAAGCAVSSVDTSDTRLLRVSENLARTSLTADAIPADVLDWAPPQPLNAVLLDAPCSATGTMRRHPDLGYIKRRKDVRAFPATQKALLKRAASFLAPGGVLVYAVCSLEVEEGPDVVETVAMDASLKQVRIKTEGLGVPQKWVDKTGALRTFPYHWQDQGGVDGFYIALLSKPV